MAKSMRSKVQRCFRGKKRETGVYAAAEAARLNRLNAKLFSATEAGRLNQLNAKLLLLASKDNDGDIQVEDAEGGEGLPDVNNIANTSQADAMEPVASADKPKPISTHGPRCSRRIEWRTSKGLEARPAPKGMNRQGGLAARRRAGRPARRR